MIATRYDGTQRLFQIGLKPLDPADWIAVDGALPAYLAEKLRLDAEHPAEVFAAEPGTDAAQSEVLALLVEHLPRRFPDAYRRDGNSIRVLPAGPSIALDEPGLPPLRVAASLVQEDLLLMRRDDSGWRLAAATLHFPSSWSLREKFGQLIGDIHGPVPGFGAGTRNGELITRMFDMSRPDLPVIRWNFSLYGDDRLSHPDSVHPAARRFGTLRPEDIFIRVERQTLRKLPLSGDILFTVRIAVDPLAEVARQPDAAGIASALASELAALTPEQLDYKGLALECQALIARLTDIGR